jgi:hypothetical protein
MSGKAPDARTGSTSAEDAPLLKASLTAVERRLLTLGYAARMIKHLAYTISREAEYPASPELHERLRRIEALASRGHSSIARDQIQLELADPRIFALLTNGDASAEMALSPLSQRMNLPFIRGLAAAARQRNPRKQGRRKFYPDTISGPDALEYCALILRIAWHMDAGKWPGSHNPTAQRFCEILWRLAGGAAHTVHGGFDAPDTFASWRKQLVAAGQYGPPHDAGKQIARILADHPPKRRSQRTEEQSRR